MKYAPYLVLAFIVSIGIAYGVGHHFGKKAGRDEVQDLWDEHEKKRQDVELLTRQHDQGVADSLDEAGVTGLITLFNEEYEIQQRKEDERPHNTALYGDACRLSDGLVQLYKDSVRTSRKN